MPTLLASGTLAADGTEQTLVTDTSNQDYIFKIDLAAMVNGETVELRSYAKCLTGGTELLAFPPASCVNAQINPIKYLRVGENISLRLTLKQTAYVTAYKTFPWALLAEAGGLSAAQTAATVLDALLADHNVVGTFGNKIQVLAPESGGNVAEIKAKTGNLPSDPASNTQVSTRLAANGYTAPDNTGIGQIKADVEHATSGLPALLAAIGTRLATEGYTVPDSAVTIATAVWAALTSGLTVTGSIGKKLADWVVGTIDTYTGNTKQTGDAYTTVGALHNLSTSDIDARLTAYNPPTRTEATADKDEVLAALANAGAIAGSGAITWVYTLTNPETSDPIGDVDVWVTTDLAGNNVIASGKTDQNGQVTFYLDAGTVYVFRQKSGWNFDNPDQEVVS